jgi:hypothetical protein
MIAKCTKAQARAWWLVECESAEAGRECIALDEMVGTGAPSSSRYSVGKAPHKTVARILASGGAR